MKNNRSRNSGFTLVEIMVVVAIVGLIGSIAIPNFIQAHGKAQTNACLNNLRMINAAIQQWAVENNVEAGTAVTASDLAQYLSLGEDSPVVSMFCPADSEKTFASSYTITDTSTRPVCNVECKDHFLDDNSL